MSRSDPTPKTPPDDTVALNVKALLAAREGKLDVAAACARKVLAHRGRDVAALMTLGFCLRKQRRLREAADCFRRVVAVAPDQPEVHFNVALCLEGLDALRAAEAAYRQELARQPAHAGALNNLGSLLSRRGDLTGAEALFRKAVASQPLFAAAHFNLANALDSQGRYDEAAESFRRTLEIEPRHYGTLVNLGVAYRSLGDLERTGDCIRAALALRPEGVEAHHNLSQLLLLKGDFANGWREYEWRLQAGAPTRHRPPFAQPRWQGEAFPGRTLLIHAEQGLGDAIQCLRFVPLAKARGGRVVIEVLPALARLCRGLAGADAVVFHGDPLPDFDLQLPIMSLPGLFVDSEAAIPAAVPYLDPDPEEQAAWRARLSGPELKVGVCWGGSPSHQADARRSLPAEVLLPSLCRAGVALYGLQKQGRPADHPVLAALGPRMTDLSGALTDFATTAAIVGSLDLVISADTSVAHLAGAIGRPVWLLTPFAPDWRWMTGRSDSPWYPTMRLFRQPREGDWPAVVVAVSQALDEAVSRRLFSGTSPPTSG